MEPTTIHPERSCFVTKWISIATAVAVVICKILDYLEDDQVEDIEL